ncbi:T9SS type A sorting domain-containing protein, partial [Calditrichota bacterium]
SARIANPFRRDDLGDVIVKAKAPYLDNTGLAWDGELLWGIDRDRAKLYAYDLVTNNIVHNYPTVDYPVALTFWKNKLLIASVDSDWLTVVDTEGNIIDLIHPALQDITGITVTNDDLLLVTTEDSDVIHVHSLINNEVVAEIEYTDVLDDDKLYSLQWVHEHTEGQLWALSDDYLYQLSFDVEDGVEVISQIDSYSESGVVGLAHDFEYLWMGVAEEHTMLRIEDQIDEQPWLSVFPTSGELEPDSEVELVLSLDPTAENFGNTSVDFRIVSNDPLFPIIEFPVYMRIIDAPIVTVEWGDENVENTIDWNEYFEDVTNHREFEIPVRLTNNGTDELIVSDISCASAYYSVNGSEMNIAIGESGEFSVMLYTPRVGHFVGRLRIETNDPQRERIFMDLTADVIEAAVIQVEGDSVAVDMLVDQHEESILSIINDGEALLHWTARAEVVSLEAGNARAEGVSEESAQRLRRDDGGDIVGSFDTPYEKISGLVWMNFLIWGVALEENRLFAFDPETEETVYDYPIHEAPSGICAVDGQLWIGSQNDSYLYRYNQDGEEVGSDEFAIGAIAGLANRNDQQLIVKYWAESPLYIYSLPNLRLQNRISLFETLDRRAVTSMTWIEKHEEGQLWLLAIDNIYQVRIFDGWQSEKVSEFECLADHPYNGLAHDRDNLWYSSWTDESFYVVDDGIKELFWLDMIPRSGSIENGDWEDVILEFNSEYMRAGENSAMIYIESSDPLSPSVGVSVNLEVHDEPVHFGGLTQTETVHEIYVSELNYNGRRVRTGWEIGAFTEDGLLAGAELWSSSFNDFVTIQLYGDDPETDAVEGFQEGEAINFVLWNDETDRELRNAEDSLSVVAEIVDGPDSWTEGGFSEVEISCQTIVSAPQPLTPPEEFYINAAYPNPFNSQVRLDYGLPSAQPVSIVIYDISGRIIERVDDFAVQVGHHSYLWDARQAPSGIYFMALHTGSANNISKVMLIR